MLQVRSRSRCSMRPLFAMFDSVHRAMQSTWRKGRSADLPISRSPQSGRSSQSVRLRGLCRKSPNPVRKIELQKSLSSFWREAVAASDQRGLKVAAHGSSPLDHKLVPGKMVAVSISQSGNAQLCRYPAAASTRKPMPIITRMHTCKAVSSSGFIADSSCPVVQERGPTYLPYSGLQAGARCHGNQQTQTGQRA
jgi:hypothetical protein